jgi:transcriptional regulator with XRE-family HTH domain
MRYPNTRYGNPTELRYYAQGLSMPQIAKQLKRSEKTVTEWLTGKRKTPHGATVNRYIPKNIGIIFLP